MKPLGHGHTTIAPQVWQNVLQPWLAGATPVPPGIPGLRSTAGEVIGWLAAGTAAGYAVVAAVEALARRS